MRVREAGGDPAALKRAEGNVAALEERLRNEKALNKPVGAQSREEKIAQGKENVRGGGRGIKQGEDVLAEESMLAALEKNAGHPAVQRALKSIDEMHALRNAFNDAAISGKFELPHGVELPNARTVRAARTAEQGGAALGQRALFGPGKHESAPVPVPVRGVGARLVANLQREGVKPPAARVGGRRPPQTLERVPRQVEMPRTAEDLPPSKVARRLLSEKRRLERQLERKGKAVEDAGGFFVSAKQYTRLSGPPRPRDTVTQPGAAGIPAVRAPKFKEFTGASVRQATFRHDAMNVVADDLETALSLDARMRNHEFGLSQSHGPSDFPDLSPHEAVKAAEDKAGGAEFSVPVRTKEGVTRVLRDRNAVAHGGPVSHEEAASLNKDLLEALFPSRAEVEAGSPEVRFVDSRLMGHMAEGGGPRAESAAYWIDSVTAAARAGILYGQGPKYIINLAQNVLTAGVNQGVFLPLNMKLMHDLEAKYPGDRAVISSIEGSGRSASYAPASGAFAHHLQRTGEFWNKITDQPIRDLNFVHAARREGFNTVDKWHNLITATKHENDGTLARVATAADYESVPFNRMSPAEKNTWRRLIIFYPWLRGASIYTARFPIEHPIQAGLYTPVAQEAYKKYTDRLLREISYLSGSFTIPKDVPLIGGYSYNPRALNTPETVVDLVRAGAGLTQDGPRTPTGRSGWSTP